MRLSKKFELNKTQAELDFIDIDLKWDTNLYVDSQLIRMSNYSHSFRG